MSLTVLFAYIGPYDIRRPQTFSYKAIQQDVF